MIEINWKARAALAEAERDAANADLARTVEQLHRMQNRLEAAEARLKDLGASVGLDHLKREIELDLENGFNSDRGFGWHNAHAITETIDRLICARIAERLTQTTRMVIADDDSGERVR